MPQKVYLQPLLRNPQGHRVWYQSKAHMWLPISDW